MNRFTRLFSFTGILAASTISIAAAVGTVSAPQGIPDGELQRWIYNTTFPVACGNAQQASAQLRARPTTAPADMHKAMAAYKECAKSPASQTYAGLQNTAIYAYSAASLMAARHEQPPQSLTDANAAAAGCGFVAGYTHNSPFNTAPDVTPSAWRTNCNRIYRDAKALTAAIQSAESAAGSAATPGAMSAPASPSH